jgi:tRNA nucleotidyltransferase (CCA-adding enzyme)
MEVLSDLGTVKEVGKSFGVYKLNAGGETLDVSLPRADSLQAGWDPHLGEEKAAARRDLTINAMLWDPLEAVLLDPFGGREDLDRKVLNAVDEVRFGDDPLRVLRAIRIGATLGFRISGALMELCGPCHLDDLPGERVWMEILRLLMEPPAPGAGVQNLYAMGQVAAVLPGLEGAGGARMARVLDEAARYRDGLSPPRGRLLMVAALLHPMRRAAATKVLDRLRLHRWEGAPLREPVLRLLDTDCPEHFSAANLTTLADSLDVGVALWFWQSTLGRGAESMDLARSLGVADAPLPSLAGGKDLVDLGVEPGPAIGAWLEALREAQRQGEVDSREAALGWLREKLASNS